MITNSVLQTNAFFDMSYDTAMFTADSSGSYLSYLSKWAHSFTRLFTLLRAAQWQKLDLLRLLTAYGTAGGSFRHLARPEQACLPGLL